MTRSADPAADRSSIRYIEQGNSEWTVALRTYAYISTSGQYANLTANLHTPDDELVLAPLHILDPHPARVVSFDNRVPQPSRSSGHARLGVVTGEREADCACRAFRCIDLQLEDAPVDGPLGREEALACREAGVDVLKVTELRHDRPRRARLAQDLDATDERLQEGPVVSPGARQGQWNRRLTMSELVGPDDQPCA